MSSDLTTTVTWGRLRTFLAVVDAGSVGGAAGALHVTPPAVSATVRALERALDTPLLERVGRGVRPSPAGLVFAEYARRLHGLLDEAGTAVREAEQGRLRLGAVATASEFVLPPLVAAFVRAHAGVQVSLTVLPRDDLFAAAARHEVDVVLAGRPPSGSGLRSHATRANRLVLVGAPGPAPDVRRTTWLLPGAGSGTRETALGVRATSGATGPTLTLGTTGAVTASAREGLGVTLTHEDAVGADLRAGRLVLRSLPGTPLERSWHLSTGARPTGAARLFLSALCDPDLVGAGAFHTRTPPRG